MTIYYSATTNAFYDSQVYNVNNIPEDKVAVAESTYKNLMAQQCAGRVIVAAADGTPTTIAQTCGPCTSTKYATKTELTNGLAAKANDSNVVHKTGDETINGVKSFGSVIKATNGTVQVGADTGYSVTFNYNGNITSKQARGTYNIFFPEGSGTLALTSDIDSKADDNNVVHKTGDETIKGNKTFNNNVTVCGDVYDKNVQADLTQIPTSNNYTQYRFVDKNDKIMGYVQHVQRTNGINQLAFIVRDSDNVDHGFWITTDKALVPAGNNTYSLGGSTNKWAKVYSDDVVHTSGNEYINGTKMFSNTIHRYADLTTSGGEQVYRFDDINANGCGHIYNNVHWDDNAVFNRHGAYNAKSGKSMEIDIISNNSGVGMAYVAGTTTKGNLETVTSATGHTAIATMGWVNNPATSTNVVHRSGDETITGNKTFSSKIVGNLQGNADTATSAGNGVDSWGGSWIRFKNGIQMCWGAGTFEETISYPKAFKVNPALICTPFSELPQSLVVNFSLKTNTLFACRLWNVHAGTWQTDGYYDWIAIGIWK